MLSCVAFGCLVLLAFSYFSRFTRRDKRSFTALVTFLCILAVVDTVFEATFAYEWAGASFSYSPNLPC